MKRVLGRHSFWVFLFLLSVVYCGSPGQAAAQGAVTTATLAGEVFDSSNSPVPGAQISVRNTETGLSRSVGSDQLGQFVLSQLPPGSYQVEIAATGFKKSLFRNVVLNIGATESLKVTLQVGELEQTVEVSAEALPPIETTKTEVSNVIQSVQVRELPLNQRSFTSLVTQQPGLVTMTSASKPTVLGAATNTGSYISAGGLMGSSVAYMVDGVNLNNGNFTAPGTAAAGDMPGVEAIQEFQVITHNFSAVYGGAAGAVVSFATRSGTNSFHGSVYEFFRNDIFDARAFFDRDKPPFRRNQFGAALGGPIQTDKTFFFANYEGLRQSLTTTDIAFVPDQCWRNSGLGGSGTGCTGGVPRTVIGCLALDPITNVCTGGTGPVAISAGVQSILTLYPLPNGQIFSSGIGEYSFGNRQPTRQDFGLIHINHSIGDKDQVSGRYAITDADAESFFHTPNFEFLREDRNQNIVLKWARTISATVVNTASFSYFRSNIFAATDPTAPLQPGQFTGNPARMTIGVISTGAGSAGTAGGTLTLLGNDDASPYRLVKNNFVINDDVAYTRGTHSLRFGGMLNAFQWNWASAVIPGGSYTFNSLNDLLAGNPGVALIRNDTADATFGIRTKLIAWYVEDKWKVRPNLTLTIGLRHEFQVPILSDVNNKLGNWRSPTDTAITVGEPYQNYSLTQFQPRIGLAYDPFGDGKTVIRAGFGVFNEFLGFEGIAQGQLQWNAPQPVLNTFFGDPNAPGFLPVIEFPTCTSCTVPTGFAGLVTGLLEPVNSPTAVQWHLEVARELPWRFSFTVTYAGSHSYHIPRKIESNHNLSCGTSTSGGPLFPPACAPAGTGAPGVAAVGFSLYSKRFDANANYNALTLQVARRVGGSLTLQTSYSFAKALSESDAFNSNNTISGVAQASQYPLDRRLDRSESLYSIRHRFTENIIYELPIGRGRKFLTEASGVQQALLGGWTITSLAEVRSGYPFSVLAGFGITGVGDLIDFPDRPNILRANPVLGGPNQYFDPRGYALQAPGNLGDAPRTSVRGPGFATVDVGIGKKFGITEKMELQFRADFFNLLNHVNFALPFNQVYVGFVPEFTSMPTQVQLDALPCTLTAAQSMVHSCNPQAGRITSTVGTPRQVQFSLKLSF